MFTGLIQTTGVVADFKQDIDAAKLIITTDLPKMRALHVGDSIAINGTCLTIISFEDHQLCVEIIPTTLSKTALQDLTVGVTVNLELALRAADALGGHLVQGHVNGTGLVKKINHLEKSHLLYLTLPQHLLHYCLKEGSIAVDGVSLTIADLDEDGIVLGIINHTWQNTIIQYYRVDQRVNIEVDIIAKYVEKWLSPWSKPSREKDSHGQFFL